MRLDAQAQEALLAYDWPGNVRELKHLISRSVLRALGQHQPRPRILTLHAADLGLSEPGMAETAVDTAPSAAHGDLRLAPGQGLREASDAFERTLIEDSLRKHQGNWAATARELKMDRANLARLAQRLGIRTVEAVSKARLQRN